MSVYDPGIFIRDYLAGERLFIDAGALRSQGGEVAVRAGVRVAVSGPMDGLLLLSGGPGALLLSGQSGRLRLTSSGWTVSRGGGDIQIIVGQAGDPALRLSGTAAGASGRGRLKLTGANGVLILSPRPT